MGQGKLAQEKIENTLRPIKMKRKITYQNAWTVWEQCQEEIF